MNVLVSCALIMSCADCKNPGVRSRGTERKWFEKLPDCPCKNPDLNGIQTNDGWAKDAADLEKYHHGATESFRSYPPVSTEEGSSCQQCCYDAKGDLIVSGSGAGTPDKISTCAGEDKEGRMIVKYGALIGHYMKDVRPWEQMGGRDSGWIKYNQLWVPNRGKNCR